nr:unnamed protein product [Digitaria exilis]
MAPVHPEAKNPHYLIPFGAGAMTDQAERRIASAGSPTRSSTTSSSSSPPTTPCGRACSGSVGATSGDPRMPSASPYWGRPLEPYWRPWTLNSFVNSFLLLRGGAPLDELEVACGEIFSDDANGWYNGDGEDVERRHQTWERSKEISRSVRSWITRSRISAPRLTSLHLVVFYGRAPFLEEMPLLVNGNVRLEDCSCADICKNKRYYGDCGDDNCRGCFGSRGDGSSVLLQGLSSATDLKLTSYPNVFIFRKDFKFCTTFSDLKTLLLNEWCLKPGFGALD